ncbi:MAG: hypothetical protein KC609_08850 [Myxococcales bacterium]|nr:hypothetical protein [Myxococcales bacterium]
MKRFKSMLITLGALAVLAGSSQAFAFTQTTVGYICRVQQSPNTILGSTSVQVMLAPNQDCSGVKTFFYLCSSDADSAGVNCARRYTFLELSDVTKMFRTSARAHEQVKLYSDTTRSFGTLLAYTGIWHDDF